MFVNLFLQKCFEKNQSWKLLSMASIEMRFSACVYSVGLQGASKCSEAERAALPE
jgi:hypothetical protein